MMKILYAFIGLFLRPFPRWFSVGHYRTHTHSCLNIRLGMPIRLLSYGVQSLLSLNVRTCFTIILLLLQIITKLERQEREPWPVERAGHAACCLGFGSQHPHLLVTGGLGNDDKTLRDAWLFDVTNRSWKEVSLMHTKLSNLQVTSECHSKAKYPATNYL